MSFKITIDVGGTFSDVVVSDFNRVLLIEKALTTRGRAYDGLADAFALAAQRLSVDPRQLLGETTVLIYGTTRATNSIVERKVAKTAFITTAGFGDTLIYREGGKFKPHDYSLPYPAPYIARRDTYEVTERIDSEGGVVRPLDRRQLDGIVDEIARRQFEAVGVSLLWAFLNPVHEIAIGQRLAERCPGVAVTLSHLLLPSIREYRRASTVCIDASLKPIMQLYLRELQKDLADAGFVGDLLISTSGGGCAYLDEAVERPILLVKSGPAMAPLAALHYTREHVLGDNVIVCDTGGTTFDVGILRDRHAVLTRETWLGGQFTGDLVNIPSIDVNSVGAGGGSIAWVDDGGLLRVGPHSAGAAPGPACYGRGGTEPTVTDAALVLGYIDPDYFLGGRIKLDVAAGRAAVERVAKGLDLSLELTADAIMRVANESMIKAIQQITINVGINPAEAVLVGGGGAAGLGIVDIGRELGCREILVPRLASAFSAAGMQAADLVFSTSRTHFATSGSFDIGAVRRLQSEMEQELRRRVRRYLSESEEQVTLTHFVEARYSMQIWELPVQIDLNVADDELLASLVEAFHAEHERVFSIRDEGSQVEFLLWRIDLRYNVNKPSELHTGFAAKGARGRGRPAKSNRRQAYFPGGGVQATPVFHGDDLITGDEIIGPAIVHEPTTTLVVPPRTVARVSPGGYYALSYSYS
ncbi:MAG: hydantoinase/oxoprolinase family protein [Dongiaceae bacterium]